MRSRMTGFLVSAVLVWVLAGGRSRVQGCRQLVRCRREVDVASRSLFLGTLGLQVVAIILLSESGRHAAAGHF